MGLLKEIRKRKILRIKTKNLDLDSFGKYFDKEFNDMVLKKKVKTRLFKTNYQL